MQAAASSAWNALPHILVRVTPVHSTAIVIKYTQAKLHHLNHRKCAVRFSACVMSHSRPRHPSPKLFSPCETHTLNPLTIILHSPFPRPLVATILLHVSVIVRTLRILCKWNHTECVVFCAWLIAVSVMSSSLICIVVYCRAAFLFRRSAIPSSRNTTFFLSIHLLMDAWVASMSQPLQIICCQHGQTPL